MQLEKKNHLAVCKYLIYQYPKVIFLTNLEGWLPLGMNKFSKQLRSGNGLPDIIIFERKNEYIGLCIELKADNVKLYK